MNRNERINPAPDIGNIEENIDLIEATAVLKEILADPPEVMEMHVYWCKEGPDGKHIPDKHGEICIEGVAEYMLLLKELGLPMPIVAISVGFPNLYKGESMSTVYANHLKGVLLTFGFTEEEIEDCVFDEASVRGQHVATDTRGELQYLQTLAALTEMQASPLSVSRAFHGTRIKRLIQTNGYDTRYISAEELLALLNPGRLTQLLDVETIMETEDLWRSEATKLAIMCLDRKGIGIQFASDTLSGRPKEFLQKLSRRRLTSRRISNSESVA